MKTTQSRTAMIWRHTYARGWPYMKPPTSIPAKNRDWATGFCDWWYKWGPTEEGNQHRSFTESYSLITLTLTQSKKPSVKFMSTGFSLPHVLIYIIHVSAYALFSSNNHQLNLLGYIRANLHIHLALHTQWFSIISTHWKLWGCFFNNLDFQRSRFHI